MDTPASTANKAAALPPKTAKGTLMEPSTCLSSKTWTVIMPINATALATSTPRARRVGEGAAGGVTTGLVVVSGVAVVSAVDSGSCFTVLTAEPRDPARL